MKKAEKPLRLLWELLTVALGVFLALFVSNYTEQQKEIRMVDKVVDGLVREIEQNKQTVKRSLDFHVDFLKALEGETENLVLQLNTAPIRKSGWDVAKSSGVLHLLDYELSLTFSEVYSWHEEYDKLKFLSDQALYFVRFSNNGYGKSEYLKRWKSAFEDFKYAEEQLMVRYEQALDMIEASGYGAN